jgi:hypothetical protein
MLLLLVSPRVNIYSRHAWVTDEWNHLKAGLLQMGAWKEGMLSL